MSSHTCRNTNKVTQNQQIMPVPKVIIIAVLETVWLCSLSVSSVLLAAAVLPLSASQHAKCFKSESSSTWLTCIRVWAAQLQGREVGLTNTHCLQANSCILWVKDLWLRSDVTMQESNLAWCASLSFPIVTTNTVVAVKTSDITLPVTRPPNPHDKPCSPFNKKPTFLRINTA